MDRPPPDPAKLLSAWMEWERGETPPGRVMSNLKTGGLRELLEVLVSQVPVAAAQAASAEAGDPPEAGAPPKAGDPPEAGAPPKAGDPPEAGAGGNEAPSPENWTPVV